MTLLPYDLTFLNPIFVVDTHGEEQRLESKKGMILKIERNNIISYGDVSPLPFLNIDTIGEASEICKNININSIFRDLDQHLEENREQFLQEKFLDFDFSKYTKLASIKHALSCAFSDYYRKKFKISLDGKIDLHGLIPNRLTHSSIEESVQKAVLLEKKGFKKAKLKIGKNDNNLIKDILAKTQKLKLRLDANSLLRPKDFTDLMIGVDKERIDYVEDPSNNYSELKNFSEETGLKLALDEHLSYSSEIPNAQLIVKPTVLGDFFTIKRAINGSAAILSSSFESQLGIFQLAQMASALNPYECHGLDTMDCYLERLMEIKVKNGAIDLSENYEILGPLFI